MDGKPQIFIFQQILNRTQTSSIEKVVD